MTEMEVSSSGSKGGEYILAGLKYVLADLNGQILFLVCHLVL